MIQKLCLKSERGSILIGVLWSLFVLGALAVAINAYLFPQMSFIERAKDKVTTYYIARAGVTLALQELPVEEMEKDWSAFKKKCSHNEVVFKDVVLGEGSFTIANTFFDKYGDEQVRYGLTDEEGKLNINEASENVLENFFQVVGKATQQESLVIASSILDWRDEDEEPETDGAETGYYMGKDEPYKSKNASFNVSEELLLVKGVTQEIFQKVEPYVTVFGGGKVNINTAPSLVLQGLGMSKTLAEKIILFRQGSDGLDATGDDVVLDSLKDALNVIRNRIGFTKDESSEMRQVLAAGSLGVFSDHFRGISVGKLNEKNFTTRIVFVFNRDKVIRYWKEY